MSWLKRFGGALVMAATAFLAFLAAMNATARRQEALKWQQRAEDEKVNDTAESVDKANAALGQAKLHAAEAERIASKAEKRIDEMAKRDETVASIVDRWRSE